jgi:hypothetical protein
VVARMKRESSRRRTEPKRGILPSGRCKRVETELLMNLSSKSSASSIVWLTTPDRAVKADLSRRNQLTDSSDLSRWCFSAHFLGSNMLSRSWKPEPL